MRSYGKPEAYRYVLRQSRGQARPKPVHVTASTIIWPANLSYAAAYYA